MFTNCYSSHIIFHFICHSKIFLRHSKYFPNSSSKSHSTVTWHRIFALVYTNYHFWLECSQIHTNVMRWKNSSKNSINFVKVWKSKIEVKSKTTNLTIETATKWHATLSMTKKKKRTTDNNKSTRQIRNDLHIQILWFGIGSIVIDVVILCLQCWHCVVGCVLFSCS